MASFVRTLSQIPEISAAQLANNAYFEVSNPVSAVPDFNGNEVRVDYIYASKKIKKEEVSKDILADIRRDLQLKNGIKDQDFGWLFEDHLSLIHDDYTLTGQKTFTDNPKHDNGITSYTDSEYDEYSVNLDAMRKYTNLNSAPTINPDFGFVTHLSSNTEQRDAYYNLFRIDKEGSEIKVITSPSFVFSPSSAKAIAQNEFVFRIRPGEKESDPWMAPASGIFTCYGWLDEINNEKVSNENRWVALMAFQEQLQVWTTLQVQPFIKNNYLSYVGFTFPVHKGTLLKVVTGFTVGSNSDKYFKNGGSLANNVANAFLGGIYTGLSIDNGSGEMPDYTNICSVTSTLIENPYDDTEIRGMISSISAHEVSCDEDYDARFAKCVKYIDPSWYRGNQKEATDLRSFRLYIGNNQRFAQNEVPDTTYGASCKAGVFSNTVFQRGWNPDKITTDGNYYDRYKTVKQIHWNEWTSGKLIQARTYEPFHMSYDSSTETTTYHERDYTLNGLSGGTIFSEGKYLYYVVSQDCTVLLRTNPDWNSAINAVQCWMLYGTGNGYHAARAMNIGCFIEQFDGIDNQIPITLPVKKGTIFMFGLYQMLNITAGDVSRFSEIDKIRYYSGCWAPSINANNMETDFLSNIVERRDYEAYTGSYGSVPTNKFTVRLNVDFSNWNDIYYVGDYTPDESRYNLTSQAFGSFMNIFELP